MNHMFRAHAALLICKLVTFYWV